MRYDSKGRELRTGEYERPDGKYEYKYRDRNGKRKSVTALSLDAGDGYVPSLRDMEFAVAHEVRADDMNVPSVEVKDKILLDIDEAIALFGLPRNHLYDIAKQHSELTYTTGRNIHFKRVPLEQYILNAV